MKKLRLIIVLLVTLLIANALPTTYISAEEEDAYPFTFVSMQPADDEYNRLMNEYLATSGGTGNISFTDGKITINETTKYNTTNDCTISWPKMPKTIKPGEKLTFEATATGKGTLTHFYLSAGNGPENLERIDGKMYGTGENTYQVEFTIPNTKRYLGIQVYGSNGSFGVGNSYIYDRKPFGGDTITLTLLRGEASIMRSLGGGMETVEVDALDFLRINDKVKTGEDTRAVISWPDGSVFKLKSNTILTILGGGLQIQVGEAWYNLQKQGSTFQVVTPTSVCGVLGTTFSVSVAKNGDSTISLYEGKLQITDKDNKNPVTLNAGEKLKSDSTGLSTPQKLTAKETSDNWDKETASSGKTIQKIFLSNIILLLFIGTGVLAIIAAIVILVVLKKKKIG